MLFVALASAAAPLAFAPDCPAHGALHRAMSTTQANAVPDTQLGLSYEEIQLLRQGQAALGQGTGGGGSNSSRAASRASSQGLLLLDSTSLAALGRYFDRVMNQIEQQIIYLSEQSQMFTMAQFDRAGNLIEGADAEIQRYHELLRQLDELELDFDRIRHIKEIVRGYRSRVEEMERELERSGSSSRHREGHHSHRHDQAYMNKMLKDGNRSASQNCGGVEHIGHTTATGSHKAQRLAR
ncbi:uncharacterized protein CLUP02_09071 [Colletotrichum lupini]|uniref:Biogenesis of lysosome-related organelles complex 1 subunit CNL1 n=1 Tax=Colletotrichum lupini TaxID=145971 RepID=A0A9Q8SU19_9PEZI|nr:uncharacterized protein CLUP02_09071 [Colletotrichum lupini]UQC83577.1 hypothetical protein CLUP02_09071 [Colletotrichum lupini]